ncbi:putative DedA-family membrane protein [Yersinia pseudotuberculosis]|uniref:DedA family protein n=1 Tax=Yersinia pseudotuberculosis TaxID=633 RepID=UPI000DFF2B0F|nr:DedA family protein [Yersinia pseudotuberculosis]SUP89806.1 putative DedA-family membrane protein [Yersinia pseudotuberculosis]
MEAYLLHLLTQSLAFTLFIVMLVTFLESLALVGMLLPGTVMMTSVGALIGSGEVDFYFAWVAATLGCLLGDWISYFIGRRFKAPLHNWSFLQKHKSLLNKTEHALHNHSMATVLLGRFIGPTRPIVPMVAGMLNLPTAKFALPSVIGGLTWPPIYLFPGILAGVAIDIPPSSNSFMFKCLLFVVVVLIWLSLWLSWRWWRFGKRSPDRLSVWFPLARLRWVTLLTIAAAIASFIWLHMQPLMPIYRHLLWKVLAG